MTYYGPRSRADESRAEERAAMVCPWCGEPAAVHDGTCVYCRRQPDCDACGERGEHECEEVAQ